MNEGFIQLHRQFLKWEWFDNANMISVYIYILLKANWKDKKWRGIEVKRGSFITSIKTMSNDLKISNQSIRTCLQRLEKTKEINKQTNNQYTVITVCKYDDYQIIEKEVTSELTNEQQTINKRLTTTNNYNNINNNTTTTNIAEVDFKKIDLWIKEISNSPTYLEGLYRLHKLKNGSVSELLITFKEHLKVFPKQHNNFSEFKKHFASWLNIKKSKRQLSKYQTQTKGQL